VQHPGNPESLQHELDAIEQRVAASPPRAQSLLLKQAGDLCASVGERRRALGWYGRAVNLHLELGEAPRASALCHMILTIQPEAVRARCTLAWLALAGGRTMETRELVEQYATAARGAGQNAMAAQQLAWMHEATGDVLLRRDLVRAVRSLGDEDRALALSATRPLPAPAGPPRAVGPGAARHAGPAAHRVARKAPTPRSGSYAALALTRASISRTASMTSSSWGASPKIIPDIFS
jgi:hypothetical protein